MLLCLRFLNRCGFCGGAEATKVFHSEIDVDKTHFALYRDKVLTETPLCEFCGGAFIGNRQRQQCIPVHAQENRLSHLNQAPEATQHLLGDSGSAADTDWT